MDTKIIYRKKIKAARAYLGYTQAEMADFLGVSVVTIQNWEYGKTLPTVDIWDKIKSVFDQCG